MLKSTSQSSSRVPIKPFPSIHASKPNRKVCKHFRLINSCTNPTFSTTSAPTPATPATPLSQTILPIQLNRILPPPTKTNKIKINLLHLPRVSPMIMLHLEERLLRHDKSNYVLFNRPLLQHNGIILGISGKPELLVNTELAARDNIPLIKRFTGGGTVYTTPDVRFMGLILNKADIAHIEPYPNPVMKWTGEIYEDCITELRQSTQHLFDIQEHHGMNSNNQQTQQQQPSNHSLLDNKRGKKTRPPDHQLYFTLNENDYTIGYLTPKSDTPVELQGQNSLTALKFAGNAQSFIRERLLHHTSVLWDLDIDNISKYLTLPQKRPAYRQNRTHKDFLTSLRPFFDPTDDAPVDYFDDFMIDSQHYLGGCKYTQLFSQAKKQAMAIDAKIAPLREELITLQAPTSEHAVSSSSLSLTSHYTSKQQEYELRKADLTQKRRLLQEQFDAVQFPNLFEHVSSQQQLYNMHAAMLASLGLPSTTNATTQTPTITSLTHDQFNTAMIAALHQHFDVHFIELDDVKHLLDLELGDGKLGTNVIPQ